MGARYSSRPVSRKGFSSLPGDRGGRTVGRGTVGKTFVDIRLRRLCLGDGDEGPTRRVPERTGLLPPTHPTHGGVWDGRNLDSLGSSSSEGTGVKWVPLCQLSPLHCTGSGASSSLTSARTLGHEGDSRSPWLLSSLRSTFLTLSGPLFPRLLRKLYRLRVTATGESGRQPLSYLRLHPDSTP